MTVAEYMLGAISRVVCGTSAEAIPPIPREALHSLYTLSLSHDVAHLVAEYLEGEGLLLQGDEIAGNFRRQRMLSVFRAEQQAHEQTALFAELSDAGISFIPLKGAVIRELYPEPWMRTSCDIDVLVKEAELERAIERVEGKLHYRQKTRGTHDVSFITPSGACVELHYALLEANRANNSREILNEVWDYARPTEGDAYHFELSDDMLYYYHIAHMAKHFENGGCGIRPFLDLWLLENRVSYDAAARRALLARGRLLTFAKCCRALSLAWFEKAPHTETTLEMAQYLLQGGVYGNMENMVAVKQHKKGGRVRYILSRLFLPYESICQLYPIVKKHRYLMPVMQVRRWMTRIFRGRWRRSIKVICLSNKVSKEGQDRAGRMLQSIGLEEKNAEK